MDSVSNYDGMTKVGSFRTKLALLSGCPLERPARSYGKAYNGSCERASGNDFDFKSLERRHSMRHGGFCKPKVGQNSPRSHAASLNERRRMPHHFLRSNSGFRSVKIGPWLTIST